MSTGCALPGVCVLSGVIPCSVCMSKLSRARLYILLHAFFFCPLVCHSGVAATWYEEDFDFYMMYLSWIFLVASELVRV